MALKVLICGGGVAGPALAYWLARMGHQVVVIDRFPTLRATGAQIDLRGQGIEVVKRMGLIDAVRKKLVNEAGVSFIDAKGNAKATILANKSGKGGQFLYIRVRDHAGRPRTHILRSNKRQSGIYLR